MYLFVKRIVYYCASSSLLTLFSLTASAGGDAMPKIAPLESTPLNAMQEFMLHALANTPYFALIEGTSVEVVDLPDDDPSDNYAEQKIVYRANVKHTFRGQQSKTIQYFAIVEKGEAASADQKTMLISLCASKEGLYWPGTGSSFPATEENKALVTLRAKQLSPAQDKFSLCDA